MSSSSTILPPASCKEERDLESQGGFAMTKCALARLDNTELFAPTPKPRRSRASRLVAVLGTIFFLAVILGSAAWVLWASISLKRQIAANTEWNEHTVAQMNDMQTYQEQVVDYAARVEKEVIGIMEWATKRGMPLALRTGVGGNGAQ